jgi:signal transduction histidine kinase
MKLGARLVLWAGFGSVLGLMAVAGLDSIRALHQIEAGNTEITQGYLRRHRSLDQIEAGLYLSSTFVSDYLLQPDPEAAKASLTRLKELRAGMESALQAYASTLGPEEASLFSGLHKEVTQYWAVLAPTLRWDAEDRRRQGYEFLGREVVPRREAMLRIANKISALNDQALSGGNKHAADLFDRFRLRVTLILATSLGLGLVLAGVSVSYILRLEQEAVFRYEEVQRAQEELQRLSARLVEAQEEERRAISRELHDQVGQSLGALLVDLGNLAAVTPADRREAHGLVSAVRKRAEESLNALRNMALLLRPSMLDDLGLVPALHWQAREVSRRTGVRVEVEAEEVADQLPEEHKTCVYRVVQEALRNCERHAQARTVRITIHQERERILLSIRDDGKGFDARRVRGLGLVGMEERVKHLGGVFQVDSRPGAGTMLRVELPLVETHVHASPAGV